MDLNCDVRGAQETHKSDNEVDHLKCGKLLRASVNGESDIIGMNRTIKRLLTTLPNGKRAHTKAKLCSPINLTEIQTDESLSLFTLL
jgi:hypothetical protein